MEVTWSWKWPGVEDVLLVSHSAADIFHCNRQISGEHERGGPLFVLPHPVAIIVGTSPDTSGIKAWLFREGGYFEAVRMDCPF